MLAAVQRELADAAFGDRGAMSDEDREDERALLERLRRNRALRRAEKPAGRLSAAGESSTAFVGAALDSGAGDDRGLGSLAKIGRAEWMRSVETRLSPSELDFFRRCLLNMPAPQLERVLALSAAEAALQLRAEMPRPLTTREGTSQHER